MVNGFHWFQKSLLCFGTHFLGKKAFIRVFSFHLQLIIQKSWLNFCTHSPSTVFFINNRPCFTHLERNLLMIQWYKIDIFIIICFDCNQNTTLREDIFPYNKFRFEIFYLPSNIAKIQLLYRPINLISSLDWYGNALT